MKANSIVLFMQAAAVSFSTLSSYPRSSAKFALIRVLFVELDACNCHPRLAKNSC
jgi:hypothetical protein